MAVADEGFNPVYDGGGDSLALYPGEQETMARRIKCFGEFQVDDINCAPFVRPSTNHFYRRKEGEGAMLLL